MDNFKDVTEQIKRKSMFYARHSMSEIKLRWYAKNFDDSYDNLFYTYKEEGTAIIFYNANIIERMQQEILSKTYDCSTNLSKTLLYLGNTVNWHACNYKQIVKHLELNQEEAEQFKLELLSFTFDIPSIKDKPPRYAFIEVKEGFFQKPTGPNEGYSYDGYTITPEFLEVKPQIDINSKEYITKYLQEIHGYSNEKIEEHFKKEKDTRFTVVPPQKIKKAKQYAQDSREYLSPKHDIQGKDLRKNKMFMGKMGEAVFEEQLIKCKIPYYADNTHHTKADKYDFVINKKTIDVKTINAGANNNLRIMVQKFEKYPMDIYVLVKLIDLTKGFSVGWCTREDIITNHSTPIKTKYGHFNYVVDKKDLRPMSELRDYLFE
jgi:hypothetical protein